MPDSLVLEGDFRTKVWLFSIAVNHLRGDFLPAADAHTRGWRFRFRHEPEWHLPLVVGGFVRSSLRRPFEGDGAEYFVFVRDSAGAQTLLERDLHLTVQESTVMRWLGGIGAGAVGDLEGRAEIEEDAFLREIALALREDEHTAVGGALAGQ